MSEEFKVLIRYYANLRGITGKKEEEVSDSEYVSDLLEKLKKEYGDKFTSSLYRNGELIGNVIILVNGININFLEGLKTKLKNEDKIDIFPPVAGG